MLLCEFYTIKIKFEKSIGIRLNSLRGCKLIQHTLQSVITAFLYPSVQRIALTVLYEGTIYAAKPISTNLAG